MIIDTVERLLEVNNPLGEGPRWHPTEHALYWCAIDKNLFYRWRPETGRIETTRPLNLKLAAWRFTRRAVLFWQRTSGLGFTTTDALPRLRITPPISPRRFSMTARRIVPDVSGQAPKAKNQTITCIGLTLTARSALWRVASRFQMGSGEVPIRVRCTTPIRGQKASV